MGIVLTVMLNSFHISVDVNVVDERKKKQNMIFWTHRYNWLGA